MNFLATKEMINKSKIAEAEAILISLNITGYSFTNYSNSYGMSVYFTNNSGEIIRISDHGVMNRNRIQDEYHFRFDYNTRSGKVSQLATNLRLKQIYGL